MTDLTLRAAQERRRRELLGKPEVVSLSDAIDAQLAVVFSEADTVGPEARHKLSGILKHYAKDPHPFRACVKDNMKRFGPGRTEAVCATLKDIIRGTTKWRGHEELDHGAPGAVAASDQDSDPCPINLTDAERNEILSSLSDEDWAALEETIA